MRNTEEKELWNIIMRIADLVIYAEEVANDTIEDWEELANEE